MPPVNRSTEVSMGASFTAVMLIVLVTATLEAELASVTCQITVRLALVAVGFSEVDQYVTLRNAV